MVPKPFLHPFFLYFVTVEIEVRALYKPSECSTTELPLQLTSIYSKVPEEMLLALQLAVSLWLLCPSETKAAIDGTEVDGVVMQKDLCMDVNTYILDNSYVS